jgi:hypothetical protein
MSTGADPPSQLLIRQRHNKRSGQGGTELVGEGEHAFQVPEADPGSAVGDEQSAGCHRSAGAVAAQRWILASATTTSS